MAPCLGGSAYSRTAGEARFPLPEAGRAKARTVVTETSDCKGSWRHRFRACVPSRAPREHGVLGLAKRAERVAGHPKSLQPRVPLSYPPPKQQDTPRTGSPLPDPQASDHTGQMSLLFPRNRGPQWFPFASLPVLNPKFGKVVSTS